VLQTYSRRRSSSASALPFLLAALFIAAIVAFQMLRGLPAVQATTTLQQSTVIGSAGTLPLPAAGSAAIAAEGYGLLGGAGEETPRPIASVTKVMTAFVILKERPLLPGQSGPSVTVSARDVTRYLQMIAEDQSVQPVSTGLVLSQLELLQGLLVPSANNYGEILANWHAGSVEAFVVKMNAQAQALGMTKTTYADTSGFSDRSVSTLRDQLILAREAMKDPVFTQVVAMPSVRLPGVGLVSSTNQALGQDGIIGIKTGFTEGAGGNLLFAAQRDVGGQRVLLFGGVLGQVDRPAAFEASRRLVAAAGQGLQMARVVSAGQSVATIDSEWGDAVPVVAAEDVSMLLWPGSTLESRVEYDAIEAPLARGAVVGSLTLYLGDQERRVPIVLGEALPKASVGWRLTRL
jgi:D-alanyl-D-alanine carboxypeptidase (penicillin-binding protein 5/6)